MAVDALVALVTVDQAKTWLKITGSTEDTLLESMVNRAGELCASFTGRKLKTATYTEYYDGNGKPELQLKNFPATAITSIHIDAARTFGADSSVDVSANVMLNGPAGIVRLWNQWNVFSCGKGNVKVVYVAGYKDATDNLVPYDLQEASLLIIMHAYKRHYQDGRIGLTSETIGDRTMNYSEDAIPKKAKEILERYMDVGASPSYGY